MTYLLDTMIISEESKPEPDERVRFWLRRQSRTQLYVSAISFGEIASGLEKVRGRNPAFVDRLERWSSELRRQFADRTLAVDLPIAVRWGHLYARLGRRDMDLLIAATALEHDLTIVTRNVRHFAPTGVKLFNPYEA